MSEFTGSEIRSKERRLQEIGKKVIACMERERNLQTELSRLRKELTSKSSFSNPTQIQRNIADQEKKLADILRERERYEQERGRLSRELEHLQQSLAWEDSLHKEEKKRKQAREKTKKEISHIAAFSAGAIAGTMSSKSQTKPQKSGKQKGGALRTFGKVFLFFIIAGAILNVVSPEQTAPSDQKKSEPSPVMAETAPPQSGMAQWIGASAGEIYDRYGETILTSYTNGGSYFYYEDPTLCPYEFFYEDDGDEVTRKDLIYSVDSWAEGTPVIENIKVGDSLQQVEAALEVALQPEAMEGSDLYPFLEAERQIDGLQYWFCFDPESKNLVYARAIKI